MLMRIKNGFDKQSDANLVVRTQNIIAAITGNPNFTTPDPSLATIQTALDAFADGLDKAQTGDRVDIAVKNQKRAELIDLLHLLGAYVLYTSKQDSAVAASSGFEVAKEPQPGPDITKPANLQVDNGTNAGELNITFNTVAGSRSYLYQYTPDPVTDASQWQTFTGTIRKCTFQNLQSGTRYWCRVAAIGPNGQIAYSDTVPRIVQ